MGAEIIDINFVFPAEKVVGGLSRSDLMQEKTLVSENIYTKL